MSAGVLSPIAAEIIAALKPRYAPGVEPIEDPRQCWGTPKRFFDALNSRYHFDIDAAANDANAMLPIFWTRADNGLEMLDDPDHDPLRVWCNPPYADIEPWAAALHDRCIRGGFSALLVPARTDRYWFHRYAMAGELHLVRGRMAFVAPPGIKESSNRETSVVVVFDPNTLNARVVRSITNDTAEFVR